MMKFINFNYDDRWFCLRINGTVATEITVDQYGNYVFMFQPDVHTLIDIGKIDQLFLHETVDSNRFCEQMGYDDYDDFLDSFPHGMVKALLNEYNIPLKLKPKKDDATQWNFKHPHPTTFSPTRLDGLAVDDKITIELWPGLYLNQTNGKYGWFVTVASLDWIKKEEVETKKGKKGM